MACETPEVLHGLSPSGDSTVCPGRLFLLCWRPPPVDDVQLIQTAHERDAPSGDAGHRTHRQTMSGRCAPSGTASPDLWGLIPSGLLPLAQWVYDETRLPLLVTLYPRRLLEGSMEQNNYYRNVRLVQAIKNARAILDLQRAMSRRRPY